MIQMDPNLQQMMEANPQMRGILSNPEALRVMFDPNMIE